MEKTTVIYGKENDAGANGFQLEAVEIHHVNPYAFHRYNKIPEIPEKVYDWYTELLSIWNQKEFKSILLMTGLDGTY